MKRHALSFGLPCLTLLGGLLLGAAVAGAQRVEDSAPTAEPPAEAQRSESGLAWVVLQDGSDLKPDWNDQVAIHFVGWTPAGVRFDSSYDRGRPIVFNIAEIFPGFREALPTMSVGEKRRIWVPAHLAHPSPPPGQPRGAVIFDVELTSFLPVPEPPAELTTLPKDAFASSWGARSRIVQEGHGKAKGDSGIAALAHYVLWTSDGRMRDTSIPRQRPTLFLYHNVLPAFVEVLKEMVEGESRYVWIPAEIANGQWVGAPQGMLIFHVELVQIMDETVLEVNPG